MAFLSASVEAGSLVLSVDAHLPEIPDAVFYRLYARIRLTKLGRGFGVRGMKGFLAEGNGSGRMTIRIPSYKEIWNIPDGVFQIQAQCVLLDSRTESGANTRELSRSLKHPVQIFPQFDG